MKGLSVEQMEIIQGGRTEAYGGKGVNYWLCNAAFIQLGAWNVLAFGLASGPVGIWG